MDKALTRPHANGASTAAITESAQRPDWALLDHWADPDGFSDAWVSYNDLQRITGMREIVGDFVGLEDSAENDALWNDQLRGEHAAMLYGAMLMWAISNGEPPPRSHELAWIFHNVARSVPQTVDRCTVESVDEEQSQTHTDPLGRWLQTARCPDWCGQHPELTATDVRNGVLHQPPIGADGRLVGELDGPLISYDRVVVRPMWFVPALYDADGNIAADAFDGPQRQVDLQSDNNDSLIMTIAQAEQLARLIRPAVFYTKEG